MLLAVVPLRLLQRRVWASVTALAAICWSAHCFHAAISIWFKAKARVSDLRCLLQAATCPPGVPERWFSCSLASPHGLGVRNLQGAYMARQGLPLSQVLPSQREKARDNVRPDAREGAP